MKEVSFPSVTSLLLFTIIFIDQYIYPKASPFPHPLSNKTDSEKVIPFQVDFTCSLKDTQLCSKAQSSAKDALDKISTALKIHNTIKIRASYNSFCEGKEACKTTTLAHAGSTTEHINFSNSTRLLSDVMYPQAIVKQYTTQGTKFNPYDIDSAFNSDQTSGQQRYWFKSDGVPIKPHQFDFEYVFLHEVLHGLGFLTHWRPYNNNRMLPTMAFQNQSVSYIALPSVFDTHLHISDYPINILWNLTHKQIKEKSYPDVESLIKASPKLEEQSRYFYEYSTQPEKIHLKLPVLSKKAATSFEKLGIDYKQISDEIILHTSPTPFIQGTSLVHFDQKLYTRTSEFVMRPDATQGRTLLELTPKDGFPIGPLTLRFLYTIGYDLNDQPLPKLGLGLNSGTCLKVSWTLCIIVFISFI